MTSGHNRAELYSRAMTFPRSEPQWLSAAQLPLHRPPSRVRSLLTSSGSLTKKIIQHCPHPFSVEVLQQHYTPLSLMEQQVLQIRQRESGNTRAVLLHCGDTPWVFAHTVIPHHALKRQLRRLTQLGNRSLGAVLHRSRVMQRSEAMYACFLPHHSLYQQATTSLQQPPDQLWGRRILYQIDGDPLLVHELFLSTFDQ